MVHIDGLKKGNNKWLYLGISDKIYNGDRMRLGKGGKVRKVRRARYVPQREIGG